MFSGNIQVAPLGFAQKSLVELRISEDLRELESRPLT